MGSSEESKGEENPNGNCGHAYKLQAKKCPKSGDRRAHLHKLQAICEDLALMGDPVNDGDFTSMVLGSIP